MIVANMTSKTINSPLIFNSAIWLLPALTNSENRELISFNRCMSLIGTTAKIRATEKVLP